MNDNFELDKSVIIEEFSDIFVDFLKSFGYLKMILKSLIYETKWIR